MGMVFRSNNSIVRTTDKQKSEEIRQQTLPHSKPYGMQVQGRDKVTAEGMVCREVQGTRHTLKENSISTYEYEVG